jgi:hypothetical protein
MSDQFLKNEIKILEQENEDLKRINKTQRLFINKNYENEMALKEQIEALKTTVQGLTRVL